jgi:hypothetical protein
MSKFLKQPGVTRTGTADEAAKHDEGYSGNGMSEFSRQAAHAGNVKLKSFEEGKPPVWTRSDLEQLGDKIAKQCRFLAAFHMRLRSETDAERREKLRKNITIKTAFIERLKQSQREALGQ